MLFTPFKNAFNNAQTVLLPQDLSTQQQKLTMFLQQFGSSQLPAMRLQWIGSFYIHLSPCSCYILCSDKLLYPWEMYSSSCTQFVNTSITHHRKCMGKFLVGHILPVYSWVEVPSSGVVFDMVTHVSIRYNVINHHNVHRLVLGLISRSRNLCHRALIHQALIISDE